MGFRFQGVGFRGRRDSEAASPVMEPACSSWVGGTAACHGLPFQKVGGLGDIEDKPVMKKTWPREKASIKQMKHQTFTFVDKRL